MAVDVASNLITMTKGTPREKELISDRTIAFALVSFALIIQLLFFWQNIENPYYYAPHLDERFYIDQAYSIANGNIMSHAYSMYMDPLLSYVIAPSLYFFDSLFVARIINIMLAAICAGIVFSIGKTLFNRATGMIAAVIYSLSSSVIFYSPILLKPISLTFIMLLGIHCLTKNKASQSLMGGILFAFASLCRSNFLLCIPLYFIHFLLKKKYKFAYLFLLGTLLGFIPLATLYYHQTSKIQILSNSSGYALYVANHAGNLTGQHIQPPFSRSDDPIRMDQFFRQEAQRRLGYDLSLEQATDYWREQALLQIKRDPILFLRVSFARGMQFFAAKEHSNNYSLAESRLRASLLQLPLFNFSFIMAMGIPGLFLMLKSNRQSALLIYPIIVILVTCAISFTYARFRLPCIPLFALGAGYFVQWLAQQWHHSFSKAAAYAMIPIAILFASYRIPVPSNDPYIMNYNLISAYVNTNQLDQAERRAKQLKTDHPNEYKTDYLLGTISLARGNNREAIAHYQHVLANDPQHQDALNNIGVAWFNINDCDKALEYFQRAFSIAPDPLIEANKQRCLH